MRSRMPPNVAVQDDYTASSILNIERVLRSALYFRSESCVAVVTKVSRRDTPLVTHFSCGTMGFATNLQRGVIGA